MVLEVYTSTKPVAAWRSWLASTILLLGVSALAQSSVSHSGGLLRERIAPADWEVSFRYPVAFVPVGIEPKSLSEHESVLDYKQKDGKVEAEIAVHRFEVAPGTTPDVICERILDQHSTAPRHFFRMMPGRVLTGTRERLGSIDALEVTDWEAGIVVRATIVAQGLAYAITLTVDPPHQDPRLYMLFDVTCQSFEFGAATVSAPRDQ